MMHKFSSSYKTTLTNCRIPSGHWKQLIASLQQTELLAGVIHEQDCRAIRTACCCLNSLRIRVEARANVTQVARPEPRLKHFEDGTGPYQEN